MPWFSAFFYAMCTNSKNNARSPLNRQRSGALQPLVCLGKMTTSNEWQRPTHCRQGRRVIGSQDVMPWMDEGRFLLCMTAPQQKHLGLSVLTAQTDECIGIDFPTPLGMRCCRTILDRQTGVEQQNPLLGPAMQRSVFGHGQPQVSLQLLEHIAQAGWHPHARRDRKCKPVGLAWAVIWILPQNHHPHLCEIGQAQGPQGIRGVHHSPLSQPLLQSLKQQSTGVAVLKTPP